MALDIHQLGARHCFACIQWDGKRSIDQGTKNIRVDAMSEVDAWSST